MDLEPENNMNAAPDKKADICGNTLLKVLKHLQIVILPRKKGILTRHFNSILTD